MRVLIILFIILAAYPSLSYSHDEGHPLSDPIYGDIFIKNWVAINVPKTMTFGFHDYEMRMKDSSDNFTEKGWEGFVASLNKSNIINIVKNNNHTIASSIRGVPTIIKSGIHSEKYEWVIGVPIIMSIHSGDKVLSQKLDITVAIERTEDGKTPDNIGIVQWIAASKTPNDL